LVCGLAQPGDIAAPLLLIWRFKKPIWASPT
jgi:hypothetical protein